MKGLEPLTVRLEGGCSIQLSYMDIENMLPRFVSYFNFQDSVENNAKWCYCDRAMCL